MGVPAISTEKKSIGEVCKLKKRGRGTTGKKSKQREEKKKRHHTTKSQSLKEKKAVDCICCHSKDGSWETVIGGAGSGVTHYISMGGSWNTRRNVSIHFKIGTKIQVG